MATTSGPRLMAQQGEAQLRQQRRRALRRRLSELIELANEHYTNRRWDAFEDTKLAIRLTLADLAGAKHRGARPFATLPPSTRHGGAEE